MHEECGIAAVYQLNQATAIPVNVSQYIPGMLLDMQNRGQLSSGISSYNPLRDRLIQTHKDLGTVGQAFRMYHSRKFKNLIDLYSGTAAIGHVRYATSGLENRNFAQPFERVHGRKWKWFSIAFNGNLANFESLKAELIDKGYHITYNTDTEVMMHYINKELIGDERRSYQEIFSSLASQFDGAFNVAFLNAMGDLVVMRDPLGIKPLCYGFKDNLLFVASESVALTRLGIMDYQDLPPGNLLVATKEGFSIEPYREAKHSAHCYFEWVYFSNLASTVDKKPVYQVRRNLGKHLAEIEDLNLDTDDVVVVPVPETSTVAADAFGFHLGVPVMDGLVRNRYVGRTFIEGETRQEVILRKFTPLPEILENKRVLLVDDSLVRAVTLKTIISDLYHRGRVGEVHVRLACPPIIAPCFYGIDIPTVSELFATKYMKRGELELSPQSLEKMAKDLGANSIKFLSVEQLAKSIGFDPDQLCLACVNTKYPTKWGNHNYQVQL